jgi:selenocysteine-specific translation elongation factor
MGNQEIGKVTHYFDRAMVALVALSGSITVGDTVRIAKGGEDGFEMRVESMQVNHEAVAAGKAGEEVAVKTTEPAKKGAVVYRATE